jgi:hypothetical protein
MRLLASAAGVDVLDHGIDDAGSGVARQRDTLHGLRLARG